MKIGKDKKQPRQRRRMTDEEKLKRLVYKETLRRAQVDPQLRAALMKKFIGIEVPQYDKDEAEIQEIVNKVRRRAWQLLLEDQSLLEAVEKAELSRILKELGVDPLAYSQGGNEKVKANRKTDVIDDWIEKIDKAEELKRKLGLTGFRGFLYQLTKPEVLLPLISLLVEFLISIKAKSPGSQPPEPQVGLKPDTRSTPVPEKDNVLKAPGTSKPVTEKVSAEYISVAFGGNLKPAKIVPESSQPGPTQDGAEWLDFSKLAYLLDLSPNDAVAQLESSPEIDSMTRIFLWLYLTRSETTVERIAQDLGPYVDLPKHGQYISRLLSESGRKWLEEVLKVSKEHRDIYAKQ